MRRVVVKPLFNLSRFGHTTIEAAEQALPNRRARAGGRVFVRTPHTSTVDRRRAGGFVFVGAWLPRTSYPCRCCAPVTRDFIREAWKRDALL